MGSFFFAVLFTNVTYGKLENDKEKWFAINRLMWRVRREVRKKQQEEVVVELFTKAATQLSLHGQCPNEGNSQRVIPLQLHQ